MDFSKISVIIIVKNGGATLLECLNSLKNFGEIVLLDNGSSDDTLEIAYKFKQEFPNLRIEKSEFIGFGALKNLALSYAKNEVIFNIDADEVLENSCCEELALLDFDKECIVSLPRQNLYKGEWIKACGWYPDYVLRVFHKDFTHFNDNVVHESLIIPQNANIIKLKAGLKHYAYDNIYGLLDKMQFYSDLWAQQNLHKKASMLKALVRGSFKFIRDYCFKKGFLYGYKGFIISFCNSLGVFFKYAKLYELTHKVPTCALIITTYNQKERLGLVLDSVKRLEVLPQEVLIADDGSTEETANLIKEYQKTFPCPLKHIWQEDKGFRAAKSRNNAVNATQCEYIIIVDGDMILDSHFIKDHLDFTKHKVCLQGGRIILNQAQTDEILNGGGQYDKNNHPKLPFAFKALRIPLLSSLIYKNSRITSEVFVHKELIKGVRSCNMSFYRTDFESIGGFNENFMSWGREDSEFVARFLFNGGELRRLKFKGIAYHLWHKENDKTELSSNHKLYLHTIQKRIKDWRIE
ncbi:glycosyltransferase family 2 protein [Campylobacter cuniculorum]|uniref:glycosyltransferase family 2 protein n=1 Tax=Campylobacter cuniculorum TaxID=374106 RepID=UPI0023F22D89|nr:glycosyltransferase [Campylobacter cuniculorum]